MTTPPAPPTRPAPPDPFALPSGAKFRFALVVTALLGTMAFIHNLLYFTFSPDRGRAVALYQRCASAPADRPATADALSYTQGFLSCIAPYERGKAWWVLGGILLLVVTATAVYLLLPSFLTRYGQLEPLSPHDPDQAPLLARLHSLSQEAGLSRPPEFLVSGLTDRRVDAYTFGRSGRHRVALAQGTVRAFGLAPERARAVVLHELAHLRNKDVDVFYLTIALALAFVPTGLLPLAVALIGTPASGVLSVTWRSLALVALVWITCVSVLRIREYGADVRAASWGAGPGLLDVVGTESGRAVPWWRRGPLALHPSAAARAAEIVRPRELFRVRFTECFAAGLAVSVAASGLLTLLWLVVNRLDALDARWTTVLLCAPAALAVMGLGVWRAALFGGGTRAVLLPGLGLGLGLVVGGPLAPQNGIVLTGRPLAPGPAALLSSLALCSLMVALSAWIARSAALWHATGEQPPGKAWQAGLSATALPFAVLLSGWMLLYDTGDGLGPVHDSARDLYGVVSASAPVGPFWLWALVEHPLTLLFTRWTPLVVALVALWLFPLATLWHRRPPYDTAWVGQVLTTSAGTAGVFAWLQILERVVLRQGVSQAVRSQDGFVLAFAYWQIAAAMLFQGVAAAVTVRSHRHDRLVIPLALLTAFLTGCLLTLVFFAGVVLAGCADGLALVPGPCSLDLPLPLVRDTLLRILAGGFLCALVGVAVPVTVGRLRGERPPVAPGTPVRHALRARPNRWLAVGVAALPASLVLGFALLVGPIGQPSDVRPADSSSAAACRAFDGLLGSMGSLGPADANARLHEAVRLALLAGDTSLATDFQGLFAAAGDQDAERFGALTDRIGDRCADEGAPLGNPPR
ncbi:M48 family metalloprotease [Streptomyces akebiae]|uniref:M48 family metalloprotease n=1 Tax=Streptomyces akebiae TaxID=2865673 RepID=A0ABX8XMQ9_9ACTN|nr:M48 family metalloprotease [Streptomyces akebiae]QYX76917.1 M48 family metalloprotease [Streptomyces akebiae]